MYADKGDRAMYIILFKEATITNLYDSLDNQFTLIVVTIQTPRPFIFIHKGPL